MTTRRTGRLPQSSAENRRVRRRGDGQYLSRRATGAHAVGAEAVGALALGVARVGAIALGAVAVGALAVGAVAIGRLLIRRARIRHLRIDELVVDRLHVHELIQDGRIGEHSGPTLSVPSRAGDFLGERPDSALPPGA